MKTLPDIGSILESEPKYQKNNYDNPKKRSSMTISFFWVIFELLKSYPVFSQVYENMPQMIHMQSVFP